MKLLSKALLLPLFTVTLGAMTNTAFARCSESKVVKYDYPANTFTELRFNALAGELEITASDDDKLHFRGHVCTDRQKYLSRMDINFEVHGDVLEATVLIPYKDSDWRAGYATMDVEIMMPASMVAQIRDSSGDIVISDVTLLSLNDSSGDIRLRNTKGDLKLRDSSGSITVATHKGNLSVQDSADYINIRDVDGNVVIPSDSSGDIDIRGVSGSVTVMRDSSGDIEIEDVKRDVNIGSDGSGSIRVSGVAGSVTIENDGTGSVYAADIEGDFSLGSKGNGDIRTRNIEGKISIPRKS